MLLFCLGPFAYLLLLLTAWPAALIVPLLVWMPAVAIGIRPFVSAP